MMILPEVILIVLFAVFTIYVFKRESEYENEWMGEHVNTPKKPEEKRERDSMAYNYSRELDRILGVPNSELTITEAANINYCSNADASFDSVPKKEPEFKVGDIVFAKEASLHHYEAGAIGVVCSVYISGCLVDWEPHTFKHNYLSGENKWYSLMDDLEKIGEL